MARGRELLEGKRMWLQELRPSEAWGGWAPAAPVMAQGAKEACCCQLLLHPSGGFVPTACLRTVARSRKREEGNWRKPSTESVRARAPELKVDALALSTGDSEDM